MTRQVVSAPPTIDVASFTRTLGKARPLVDPSRAMCAKYGYQTLYEMPVPLQKRARIELIESHAAMLASDPDALCDHSVFVWLADWMRWLWGSTPTEEWGRVLAAAAPAAGQSEVIHHVVDGPRAAYDGYRWLDARHAEQLDPLVRLLYREFGCEPRVREVRLPR